MKGNGRMRKDMGRAYIHPDGRKYEGEWKDGHKWNIEYKNKYGQTIRRWENGVLQK